MRKKIEVKIKGHKARNKKQKTKGA